MNQQLGEYQSVARFPVTAPPPAVSRVHVFGLVADTRSTAPRRLFSAPLHYQQASSKRQSPTLFHDIEGASSGGKLGSTSTIPSKQRRTPCPVAYTAHDLRDMRSVNCSHRTVVKQGGFDPSLTQAHCFLRPSSEVLDHAFRIPYIYRLSCPVFPGN